MIRCYQCGTDNLDGSEYCDECGKKLDTTGGPVQPKRMPSPPQLSSQAVPPPPSFTRETITPKPATPYTPPPPPPPISPPIQQQSGPQPEPQSGPQPGPKSSFQMPQSPPMTSVPAHQNQTSAFNGPTSGLRGSKFNLDRNQQPTVDNEFAVQIRARLVILRGGKVGKEFPITGDDSLIGRWDADGGIFPDVDLDQDDPEAKISRRHARIHFHNNQFLIEDLGSTNGTFINRGPRLLPGNKQPLNNGDEIIVGKTFLKFVLS